MTQTNLKSIANIVAAVLLLGATGNARANLITFDFEATVDEFGFGTSLTGSYTFNSDTSDASPSDDLLGTYTGAIVAMDIALPDLTASATAPPSEPVDIIVRVSATPGALGQYQVLPLIPLSGNPVAGTTLVSFEFTLAGVQLTSDALPTSPPNYAESSATLGFVTNGVVGPPIFGTIDSISTTTIPEPATVLLLGLALIAAAPKVRRKT